MAQIIVAIQMVVEQKFLNKYDVPPLLAVGLEGIFTLFTEYFIEIFELLKGLYIFVTSKIFWPFFCPFKPMIYILLLRR